VTLSGSNQGGSVPDPFLIQEEKKLFGTLSHNSPLEELTALMAIGQYNLDKQKFVENYQQVKGIHPTEAELNVMISTMSSSSILSETQKKAEVLVKNYAQEYLNSFKQEEIISPIENVVKKHTKTNYYASIGVNVFSSFLYSLVIALIIFTVTAMIPNNKFSKAIKILMDDQTTEKVQEQPKQ
jgi:hypothetical protein